MKKIKRLFKKYSKLASKKVTVAMLPFLILVAVLGYFTIGLKKVIIIVGVLLICSLVIDFIKGKRKPNRRKKKKNIGRIIFNTILVFIIVGIVGLVTFIAYIALTAPKFEPDALYKKEATVLYDSSGKEITKLGLEIRDKVTFEEIPEVLVNAILATEDSRYYQHNGFDLPRFLKAATSQVVGNSGAGGASTITMQVVKNNITDTKVSVIRKFTDIYMSMFVLERKYSKEQIFEFYVNVPYLGSGVYGVAEASRVYFGKEVKDINLAEASFIAGLFQSPTYYGDSAWTKPERIEKRRNTVLYLMKRHGYITEEEEKIAKAIPIEALLKQKRDKGVNPYQSYIDIVINEVEKKTGFSPYKIPMKIYTALDTKRQDIINEVVNTKFPWPNEKTQTGIAITNIKTGALIAVSGGRNVSVERGFNRAIDLNRQPGSTAKPFYDYGPGIEYENWSTYTPFLDSPHNYTNGKSIKNWDNSYLGLLTLREALGLSRNIPALRAFQSLNNKQILNFVMGLGLKPEVVNGYIHEAHALGAYNGSNPVQMAAAYAAFANQGYYIEPYTVTKIIYTESGDVDEFTPVKNRAMKESTAYVITDALKWSVTDGISGASGRVPGYETAVKTGTSNYDQDFINKWKIWGATNDLWSAGYSQDYSMALWYGYDKITAESAKNKWYNLGADSGRKNNLYNMIFKEIVKGGETAFITPKSIVPVTIELNTIPAQLPSENTPANMRVVEYFSRGTEPTTVSPRYLRLDNPSNLNATITGNKVNLSWTAIPTPQYYTEDYMTKHFKNYYGSSANEYLAKHKEQIAKEMGVIGYDIYYKGEDNVEHYITTTISNNIIIDKPQVNGKTTIVVKSAFSIFKASSSIGTTYSFENEIIAPSALYSVNFIKSIGSGDIKLKDLIKIMNNGIDVTDNANISYTLLRTPGVPATLPISTVAAATYTIEYTIKYKGVDIKTTDGNNIKQNIEIK